MDLFGIFRTLGSLAILLGMLAGALWAVRRFDIRLPGRTGGGMDRRLQLVERLGIDQRRSLLIVRRDDREHLMVIGPEGSVTVESFASRSAQGEPAGDAALLTSPNFATLLRDDVVDWALAKRSRCAAQRRND